MFICALAVALLYLPAIALAAEASEDIPSPSRLKKLSLEELLDIDVTSVSKYPEKLSIAAAAITALTQEDIHRSGVSSIPEALRLIPGMSVARLDSHNWAISSRGFNDIFANKLLVMIDGRTVYTPLFSGVFWEVQDTMLEDIDRIEVVRGPGATLWGANAVNGVINIITKSARQTQGLLITAGGGTEERAFTSIRYGVKVNPDAFLRVYAKYYDRDSAVLANATDAHDSWDMFRAGFRLDWDPNQQNALTLQGDIYAGREDQTYFVPIRTFPFAARTPATLNVAGGNVLGRWTRNFSNASTLTVQAYYDRTVRNTPIFSETRDTGDFDLQHRFTLGDRQEVVWGLGYRATGDNLKNTLNVTILPASRTLQLFSAFVQDDISIVPERLRLTIGSKFEHNDFTGLEVQPSVRALWTPGRAQTIWAAVSRAVRTPSIAETSIRLNPAPPAPIPPGRLTINGNPAMDSEKLVAYELGYRVQPIDQLKFDLALFYNDYDQLRTLEPIRPGPVSPSLVANNLEGHTYGAETTVTAQVSQSWRLQGSYSYLKAHLHPKAGSRDLRSEGIAEGSSPRHQFFLRSLFDLGWGIQFDSTLRYVDALPWPGIPSYVTLDARLAWSPRENVEFAVIGQNLLDDRHPEFAPTFIGTQPTEVQRSVFGTMTLRF